MTATLFTFLWQNTEDNRREKKIVTTFLLATRKIRMSFLSELKVYNQVYNLKGIVTIIIPLTFYTKHVILCTILKYVLICFMARFMLRVPLQRSQRGGGWKRDILPDGKWTDYHG